MRVILQISMMKLWLTSICYQLFILWIYLVKTYGGNKAAFKSIAKQNSLSLRKINQFFIQDLTVLASEK